MKFSRCFYVLLAASLLCSLAFAQQISALTGKNLIERLGYPANSRLLIIHGDDFGMVHTVDTATMEALENHWITSASILVPCPWFPEVARWAKSHSDADLGIHLALNSEWTGYRWRPVSPQPATSSLLDPDGYLPLTYQYVAAHAKVPDVETEMRAQINEALANGIHISHLDDHMGTIVNTRDLLQVYLALGREYKVPVRLGPKDHLFGIHLAPQTVLLSGVLEISPGIPTTQWLETYENMLRPLGPGVYQLLVHLAHNDEEIQGATFDHPDWGAQWRQNDFDLVRNPEFREFLKKQGFILISWRDIDKAQQSLEDASPAKEP